MTTECGPLRCRQLSPSRFRGMTLVEVLAVVVILGLIAGTLVMGFSNTFGKARHELARSGIGQVVSKIELYRIEAGGFPTNDEGLNVLTDGSAAPTASFYMSRDQLLDPWGRSYLYVIPGPDGHPYEVLTYGADGQPGGAAGTDDVDISSTNLRGSQPGAAAAAGAGPGAGAGAP